MSDQSVTVEYIERTKEKTERVVQSMILNKIYLVEIKNALLYNQFALSLSESSALFNHYNGIENRLLIKSLDPKIKEIVKIKENKSYFLVDRALSSGYYHFLCQVIPSISLCLKSQASPIFILNKLESWKKSIIEYFFGDNLNILEIEKNIPYQFKKITIPSISFRFGHPSEPEAWHKFDPEIYRLLKEKTQPASATPRKIIVSRRNLPSKRRVLRNCAELENAVVKIGYTVVEPQNLTIEKQIELFSNATHIIAESGAALSNIVFCKPGTKVIIIQYSTGRNRSGGFALFGSLHGLDCFTYNEYNIETSGSLNNTDSREWSCSVDQVISYIKEIEKEGMSLESTLSRSEYKYTSENRYQI